MSAIMQGGVGRSRRGVVAEVVIFFQQKEDLLQNDRETGKGRNALRGAHPLVFSEVVNDIMETKSSCEALQTSNLQT